jgi:hypothetical protein
VSSGTGQVDFLIVLNKTRSSLLLFTPGRQEISCSFVHRIPDSAKIREIDDTTALLLEKRGMTRFVFPLPQLKRARVGFFAHRDAANAAQGSRNIT